MRQGDWALLVAIAAIILMIAEKTADRFTAADAAQIVRIRDARNALRDEQLELIWDVVCVEDPLPGCERKWDDELAIAGMAE